MCLVSKMTIVNHVLRFTHAAFNRVRLNKLHLHGKTDCLLNIVRHFVSVVLKLFDFIAEQTFGHLNLHFERVECTFAVNNHKVVRSDTAHLEQCSLNLRREYVHTANDKHVIASANETAQARKGTSTFAFTIIDACQILRAVADKRETFLRERGEHKFANDIFTNRLQSVAVNDFRNEVVFVYVQAFVILAVTGNARTHHFAQSVDVIRLDVEHIFNLIAHLLRPRFSTADCSAQLYFVEQSLRSDFFCNVEQVRRSAGNAGYAEVNHHGDELLRVARRHWHYRGTDIFRTVVSAQSASKEAVAVCNLNDVVLGEACIGECTSHTFSPHFNIMPRVANDSCLAGSAT